MAGKSSGGARWREILDRQAGSGLSVRGFCAAEGISEPSFYAWRKKLLAGRENGSRRVDRPVNRRGRSRRREETDGGEGLFVPLKLVDAAGPAVMLEIVHPLGYRIHVSGDVNPLALRQVIEVLDARGAR